MQSGNSANRAWLRFIQKVRDTFPMERHSDIYEMVHNLLADLHEDGRASAVGQDLSRVYLKARIMALLPDHTEVNTESLLWRLRSEGLALNLSVPELAEYMVTDLNDIAICNPATRCWTLRPSIRPRGVASPHVSCVICGNDATSGSCAVCGTPRHPPRPKSYE